MTGGERLEVLRVGSRPVMSVSGETRAVEGLGRPLRSRPLGQPGDADGPLPESQRRVERLLEGSTEGVQVAHAARHVVEGEDASLVIQEDPEPVGVVPGAQAAAVAVVKGPVLQVVPLEAPGLSVAAQAGGGGGPATAQGGVGRAHPPAGARLLHVHFPVVAASSEAVAAQHLPQLVETQRGRGPKATQQPAAHSQAVGREPQERVHRVGIQRRRARVCGGRGHQGNLVGGASTAPRPGKLTGSPAPPALPGLAHCEKRDNTGIARGEMEGHPFNLDCRGLGDTGRR